MRYLFIIILILSAMSGILLFEARRDSGTYDEIAHITAGYTYLYLRDFRLYPDNPPLIKMISTAPWWPIAKTINFPKNSTQFNDPGKIDQWSLGKQFLYQSGNDADKLIFLARLPIILITLLLGLLVYKIGSELYGQKAGILALLLFALSPDIRAHGHLATTDVGATFFAILGIYLFWKELSTHLLKNGKNQVGGTNEGSQDEFHQRASEQEDVMNGKRYSASRNIKSKLESSSELKRILGNVSDRTRLFLPGIIFSLALLSKYSMWFMAATLLIITTSYVTYVYLRKTNHEHKKYAKNIWLQSMLFLFTSYISLWIFSFLLGYTKIDFNYKSVPLNKSAAELLGNNFGWKVFHLLPFPYYYRIGLETMYARNIMTQPTYLLGSVIPQGGSKLFFPISYFLKTPLPIIILLLLTLILVFKKKDHKFVYLLPFLFGLIFFLIITLIGNLSIGTRFFYPTTVLFIIFASSIGTNLLILKTDDINGKEGKILRGASFFEQAHRVLSRSHLLATEVSLGRAQKKSSDLSKIAFLVILILWLLATNIYSFPYDISYINELGGGTYGGYNSLVDSSYDWGQDLKRFANWYHMNIPDQTIYLSYLGIADPSYYGLKYQPLTFSNIATASGIIALSVTNLKLGGPYYRDQTGRLTYDDTPLSRFKISTPYARIGTTIFVYKF